MKQFKITITWDRLREGEFPAEQLKNISSSIEITSKKLERFTEIITISDQMEQDEDELVVAYELGRLIHSISVSRYGIR
jgi:hypothetical protein